MRSDAPPERILPLSEAPAAVAPRQTANPAPPRPRGSIRRTSSIDVSWPDGMRGNRLLIGGARDYRTPPGDGSGSVIAEATMTAELDFNRTIVAITADPAPAGLEQLVGERGGGHLRLVVAEKLPQLAHSGDPLYLLIDDISGVSLVSSWAWSQWDKRWLEQMHEMIPPEQLARMMDDRAGVCWGLKPGSSGLDTGRESVVNDAADGGELRHPGDPEGWHAFPVLEGVSMRRARRIDVWRSADAIHIDAAFQDSAPRLDGGRAALHEYRISATADPETLKLRTLDPEPRVLPFPECPGAVRNALTLVGTPLPEIRDAVLAELRGPAGCTHLNDALRALAEVPRLLAHM
jgi:hypothetical protein